MLRAHLALSFALAASLIACREPFHGPHRLLESRSMEGRLPRSGAVTTGGETRPALLESARYAVRLPRRPLLTLGMGLSYAGEDEAPGWFRLVVRAGGRVMAKRTLNPRAARGWRDLSLPLEGLGRKTTIEFEVRFTDREGRVLPAPPDLLLGVADPTVHDLDTYGRAKGVVLVSIDTLRRDHVGAYGYARPTTPRLDRVAQEGIVCEDAVSTSSWTLPAHLSLLTSADPSVHGGVDMNHGFNRRAPTLAALLKRAGFATQAVTSHLYVSAVYGLDQGFDHLDFQQDRKAAEVAERAIALLDRLGDRPFFLLLHFYDPHWHYDPPEHARKLFERPYTGALTGFWQDFSKRGPREVSPADLQHLLDLYDGEIRYTDDQVGRVLDHLKARGLDSGTLVVITSDHGEEFLEHGSWEHQKTLYEEVIRIPLLVRGPGVAPRRESAQTSLLDVAPTILGWAGLDAPASFRGRSLLASPGERDAYGETDHTADRTRKLFLRGGQGRWKTILSLSRNGREALKGEWYDLASDPAETRNAPPRPEAVATLRQRALDRWRQGRAGGGGSPVQLTPEQKEKLKALGYVGP